MPLYIEFLISKSLITARVSEPSSIWRIMAPWSDLSITVCSISGTLSSTHIPADWAKVAPVIFVRVRFLIRPPELPHTFRPLVTASLTDSPSILGAEPAPMDNPIPYLQYVGKFQSWPASSITRLRIVGVAELKRSTPTSSGFQIVTLAR